MSLCVYALIHALIYSCTHLLMHSLAEVGVEPTRPFGQGILSPQRLPFRHSALPEKLIYFAKFCKLFPNFLYFFSLAADGR